MIIYLLDRYYISSMNILGSLARMMPEVKRTSSPRRRVGPWGVGFVGFLKFEACYARSREMCRSEGAKVRMPGAFCWGGDSLVEITICLPKIFKQRHAWVMVIEVRGDACLAAAMNWCFVDSFHFFLGKSWGFIWLVIRTFGCSLLIYDMHRYINPLNNHRSLLRGATWDLCYWRMFHGEGPTVAAMLRQKGPFVFRYSYQVGQIPFGHCSTAWFRSHGKLRNSLTLYLPQIYAMSTLHWDAMARTVFDDIAKPFRRFNFELNIWMISIGFWLRDPLVRVWAPYITNLQHCTLTSWFLKKVYTQDTRHDFSWQ